MKPLQIIKKIRDIIFSSKSDQDKVIDIGLLIEKPAPETANVFGAECEVERRNGRIIFNGGSDIDPLYNPALASEDSRYYSGCGCTWDTDLMGNRYWLLDKRTGEIYDERARIEGIVLGLLKREGIL